MIGVDAVRLLGVPGEHRRGGVLRPAEGLPGAIPEWGLNGSDDPSFINGVAAM